MQFTVRLPRNVNPSLALRVQNIITPNPFSRAKNAAALNPYDLFLLNLDTFTLKRVIESLAVVGQELAEEVLGTHEGDEEFLVQSKNVIVKWLLYAKEQKAIKNFVSV